MNIAINGFGRIGRAAFKILLNKTATNNDISVVAVNDLAPVDNIAYLLQYDSVYGKYEKPVTYGEDYIQVSQQKIPFLSIKDPSQLPWRDLSVDVVLECTGIFTTSEKATMHIEAGAKKVVLSAPAKDDGFKTLVFGSDALAKINSNEEGLNENLISNASCTTNCVTPIVRVLSQAFGIEKALLTTIHAYTSTQSLVDGPNKKNNRRGRSAAQNIIPTSTGAAKATIKVMDGFDKTFDGVALRVPVICGSISDITALLKQDVTVEQVNSAFKEYQQKPEFSDILKYSEEPLVSTDIIKAEYSAIVDSEMTRVVGGNLVKIMAWYDNEWGYAARLVDMALFLSEQLNKNA